VLACLAVACGGLPAGTYRLSDTNIMTGVSELVRLHPEEFSNPFTLLILVDGSGCGKTLQETPYWRDWQRSARKAGWGFVFGTSRADSAGLVWAAGLDSVEAPVLVLPGCEDSLQELGLPRGASPLKLLIDSTTFLHRLWNPVGDTAACRIMTEQIDSVSRANNYAIGM